jgi:hypothetical protein
MAWFQCTVFHNYYFHVQLSEYWRRVEIVFQMTRFKVFYQTNEYQIRLDH